MKTMVQSTKTAFKSHLKSLIAALETIQDQPADQPLTRRGARKKTQAVPGAPLREIEEGNSEEDLSEGQEANSLPYRNRTTPSRDAPQRPGQNRLSYAQVRAKRHMFMDRSQFRQRLTDIGLITPLMEENEEDPEITAMDLLRPLNTIVENANELQDAVDNMNEENMSETMERINKNVVDPTVSILMTAEQYVLPKSVSETLSSVMNELDDTTLMLESVRQDQKLTQKKVKVKEKEYFLGLVEAGAIVEGISIFSIPNAGNMDCSFDIMLRPSLTIRPDESETDVNQCFFFIDPVKGIIKAGSSITVFVHFTANCVGLYQQSFEVFGDGDSIFRFSVAAKVGEARLKINKNLLTFGEVPTDQVSALTFTLSNDGNYGGKFLIEAILPDERKSKVSSLLAEGAKYFSFSAMEGIVVAGEELPISVGFKSPRQGTFLQKFLIKWSGEPILLECQVTAGSARIQIAYEHEDDKIFAGLDFGEMFLGGLVPRIFSLNNSGTQATDILFHPSDSRIKLSCSAEPNEHGLYHIGPKQTIRMRADIISTGSLSLQGRIEVASMDGELFIPVKATVGLLCYDISADPPFSDTLINVEQSRVIRVVNMSTVALPFRMLIKPDEIKLVARVDLANVKPKSHIDRFVVAANSTAEVTITLKSKQPCVLQGEFDVGPSIENNPSTFIYPLLVRVWERPITIDDTSKMDMGSVTIGESATVVRRISNHSTRRMKYRVKLELVKEVGGETTIETHYITPGDDAVMRPVSSKADGSSESTSTGDAAKGDAPKENASTATTLRSGASTGPATDSGSVTDPLRVWEIRASSPGMKIIIRSTPWAVF
jgi:hypothetical protein